MVLATPNSDGSIGFGLNIVLPSGQPVPLQARISVATLSGSWTDAAATGGVFAFGVNAGGTARPDPIPPGIGDITGVIAGAGLTGGGTTGDVILAVDTALVQRRVTTTCSTGQAVRSIAQDGTAVCEPMGGGGDVTGVIAGPGLTGGGLSGDLTLAVAFAGTGSATAAARSDHHHGLAQQNTSVGDNALSAISTGSENTAIGRGALPNTTVGFSNTATGTFALLSNIDGTDNTATGSAALVSNESGSYNTAAGSLALVTNDSGSYNSAFGASALEANAS